MSPASALPWQGLRPTLCLALRGIAAARMTAGLARGLALLLAALWLAVLPARAAEPLPAFVHTTVNDFAAILTPADVQIIDEALIALQRQTGIQGTVVTLPDRSRYGDESLEAFSRRLFDTWGVGDARRDDGFMVLVIPPAREIRIVLGAGYDRSTDVPAADIFGHVIGPAFRAGRLSEGLRDGTLAIIERIARPYAAGMAAGARGGDGGGAGGGDGSGDLIGLLLPAAVFGVFGISGFGILRGILRRRRESRCPQCGGGLISQDEMRPDPLPGGIAAGQRLLTRRCTSCGWNKRKVLAMPVSLGGGDLRSERGLRGFGRGFGSGSRSGGSGRNGGSGGFGGGRSGGGGASGRW